MFWHLLKLLKPIFPFCASKMSITFQTELILLNILQSIKMSLLEQNSNKQVFTLLKVGQKEKHINLYPFPSPIIYQSLPFIYICIYLSVRICNIIAVVGLEWTLWFNLLMDLEEIEKIYSYFNHIKFNIFWNFSIFTYFFCKFFSSHFSLLYCKSMRLH